MEKLLKANFRKGRTGLIVVTVLITLAVFLLTVGLTLIAKVPTLYAEKAVEINSPDFMMGYNPVQACDFSAEVIRRIDELEYVEKTELSEAAVLFDKVDLRLEGKWSANRIYFQNKDGENSMKPVFHEEATGEGIPLYYSIYEKIQNNISAGQKLTLTVKGTVYPCYVAGFYESILLLYFGGNYAYVDQASYDMLREMQLQEMPSQDPNAYDTQLISQLIRFNEPYDFNLKSRFLKDYDNIYKECRQKFIDDNQVPPFLQDKVEMGYFCQGSDDIVSGSEPYMLLISVMMIVFSLIMTAVALIIINFLIRSGIEDDMRNIGILKALGYTTRQLRLSYLALYGILVAAGAILGMIVALSMTPVFNQILTIIANLPMAVPPSGLAAVISVALAVAVSLATVALTTKKLKGITPLFALRGAISSHSFKKNAVPLESSKLGINVTIGLKTVIQNKRQSIMMFVIVGVMTLLCAFSTVLYYNMNVDKSAMLTLSGEENYEASIELEFKGGNDGRDADYNAYFDRLAQLPEVEKLNHGISNGWLAWANGDVSVAMMMAKDYSVYETDVIYDGRYPTLPTECAVSGDIRKALNLKIGDVLRMSLASGNTAEKIEKEFTVVGFGQGLYMNRNVLVTDEGMSSISTVAYASVSWWRYVYLHDGADIDAFFTKAQAVLKEMYSDCAFYGHNAQEMIQDKVFKIISPASALLMDVIIGVTAIVVFAVVFMIIRMKMIREKKNIAISKALGYTSWQIMHQTGLSMLLIALPAALLGALLGGVLVNPFMELIGGFIGLYRVSFTVNYGLLILIGLAAAALNYAVALLVSLGTRFITPRSLVSQ